MARIVRNVAIGGAAFGGILYGRLYVDVLMAESTVRSIDREMRATLTEQDNLKHEITSNKKALVELEAKGTAKLEEQANIRHRVEETTGLLTKLKNELLQSEAEFERLQMKIRDASNKVNRLQATHKERDATLELAKGRKEHATKRVEEARNAMALENLPVMGPLLFKPRPSK